MDAYGELHTCTVSGHKVAYHRTGSGEPLLLVHGITTYSFIWERMIPMLTERYDCIAIDLLGCGDSDKPLDVSYSLKNHSKLIHEFARNLGLEKFHMVCHDVGGGIGQIFAVNYPEMLHDLAVINTVAYDFWPVQPIIAMRTPIIRQMAMATLDIGAFKIIVNRGIYHKERLTDELMGHFFKPMKTKEGRKAFLHFARCLDNRNLMEIAENLPSMKVPLLIIRGDADVYLGSSIARKLHSEIPGSRLEIILTGGHFIQVDEPETVVQMINSFISGG
jgi:pimeloyl-ACP methyl ester carboxylesterase